MRWVPETVGERSGLPPAEELGLDPAAVDALNERAAREAARHPDVACQVALARNGRLASFRCFGSARFGGVLREARADDLLHVFSVTKTLVSSACWLLLQEGKLALGDTVASIVPEFAANGKQAVTVEQLLTHTAGFPRARLDPLTWDDPEQRLATFAGWELEWEPGSRFVYHGLSSMWVLAELITRRSGMDYRDAIRSRILDPLGLRDLFLGLPASESPRVAEVVNVGEAPASAAAHRANVDAPALEDADLPRFNRPEWRAVGVPGGGAVGSAAAIALFYQALLADAAGAGPGLWRAEALADAWSIRRPELVDGMTGQPALRGLGVVIAGEEGKLWRGFAEACSPRSFGHMGAGGQISWADPASGLSFAYLTSGADRNPARQGARGFRLSTLAAACVRG